ncbi:hypothetical protein AB205_0095740 [Aquarana catesbeiana]|uniref:Uncharacterized protein n=1 Tax=Aquarana catesbeiana TaxID=8400 RepID=A0A2G9RF73_AQUCT|nr:hypothetical protein AB205_0095740 [Aquarana catesbeiana]
MYGSDLHIFISALICLCHLLLPVLWVFLAVDPSRERRDAVKRKISQYLKRAEEIFNCHLQRPLGSVGGAAEGYSSLRFRPIRVLSAAVENLKRCQVLQIIDKVTNIVFQCMIGHVILWGGA